MLGRISNLKCLVIPGRFGSTALSIAIVLLSIAVSTMARADGGDCPVVTCLAGSIFDCSCDHQNNDDEKPEEPKCHYGPCCCQPRKTLMQWSYGTSFSGGPPGMDEPLEADRPDFTESPLTVGRGVVQIESGYTFTHDSSAGVQTANHSFPQTLFRIGMFAEWFEFRLFYNYESNDVTLPNVPGHQHTQGSDDLELGMKICLTPQEGILPKMGLIPAMTVPSGAAAFTKGDVMPGLTWAYGWDITKKISLGMTTVVDRDRDDAGNVFVEFAQSGSFDFELTKKLHCYTELYLISPTGHTIERVQYYFDGGFTYHVTNNVQLDIEAGVGLNEAANDYFAGSGAVVRF